MVDNFIHDIGLVLLGLILAVISGWVIRFWRQSENTQRRDDAAKVLAKHGLSAELYLSTIGIEDDDLRMALAEFEHSGYIVFDEHKNVVGKVAPKVVKGNPKLRLVVDND